MIRGTHVGIERRSYFVLCLETYHSGSNEDLMSKGLGDDICEYPSLNMNRRVFARA